MINLLWNCVLMENSVHIWGNTTSMCLVVWMTALWLTHSVVCFNHCRYRENPELLDVCALLDPHVKGLNYLSSAERIIVHEKVLDLCASQADVESSQDTIATQSQSGTTHDSSGLSSILGSLYACSSSHPTGENNSVQSKHESIKQYLAASDADMDGCPLLW